MGGRGASSASKRQIGLPGGAAAFTVGGERPMTFYQSNDVVLLSGYVRTTYRGFPVRGAEGLSISQLYERAKSSGQPIELHSSAEMEIANAAARKRKEENRRDVGYTELHPNVGRTGIPARKLLHTKKRARGGLYY